MVRLDNGQELLLHISELADHRVREGLSVVGAMADLAPHACLKQREGCMLFRLNTRGVCRWCQETCPTRKLKKNGSAISPSSLCLDRCMMKDCVSTLRLCFGRCMMAAGVTSVPSSPCLISTAGALQSSGVWLLSTSYQFCCSPPPPLPWLCRRSAFRKCVNFPKLSTVAVRKSS